MKRTITSVAGILIEMLSAAGTMLVGLIAASLISGA